MTERQEKWLTWGLLGLCGLILAVNLWPRLTVRRVKIQALKPDISVSIMGAVQHPGFYTLPWGARLKDLIAAAGGLTPAAEQTLVNPAQPLESGQKVVVPKKRTPRGDTRVSLNTASEEELERLPGIGPALAQRVIAARPFSSVADLLKVSGIGPKTLEELKPYIKP